MAEKTGTPLTPVQILEASLRKEKAAYRFYEGMLKRTQVLFIRDLLEELRDSEAVHAKTIETKIAHLRAGKKI